MAGKRDEAEEFLKDVPPLGQQVNSIGPTAALFTKLTGVTQAALEANWKQPPPFNGMTTCNEFVGRFGATLGSKKNLGRFDIDTELAKWGKGLAWVPSGGGARPKYGDIFLRKGKNGKGDNVLHMGISLDFDDATWHTAESGQGGKNTGYDVIKRKQSTFPGDALQGWVDLELYFESAAQTGPVPEWLCGWWKVTWRGQAFYYYFDRNRQVKWTQILPADTSRPPLAVSDTGTFEVLVTKEVITRWAATGTVEKFSVVWNDDEQMRGMWNGTERLSAVSM